MKINGKSYSTPNEDVVVFPRGEDQIVFRLRAVLNMKEFNALCKEPTAPIVSKPSGLFKNEQDPTYKKQVASHNAAWNAYLVIKTLEPSNIEWETVNWDDWTTWSNWESDMINACFTQGEINHLFRAVLRLNALSDDHLLEARQSFLLSQALRESQSSPNTEQ
jgi:hypothetical protein